MNLPSHAGSTAAPAPGDDRRPGLDDTLSAAWEELRLGVKRGRHAWHTPALATVGEDGPEVRTVVLRAARERERELICHTDSRSPKVAELLRVPRAAWMFYDRDAKVQLRAAGAVTLHQGDALAQERWAASAARSRACYHQALKPGQVLDPGRELEPGTEMADGFEQFMVLRCELEVLDWLYLRGKGHWRARWDWDGQDWQGAWVAP